MRWGLVCCSGRTEPDILRSVKMSFAFGATPLYGDSTACSMRMRGRRNRPRCRGRAVRPHEPSDAVLGNACRVATCRGWRTQRDWSHPERATVTPHRPRLRSERRLRPCRTRACRAPPPSHPAQVAKDATLAQRSAERAACNLQHVSTLWPSSVMQCNIHVASWNVQPVLHEAPCDTSVPPANANIQAQQAPASAKRARRY